MTKNLKCPKRSVTPIQKNSLKKTFFNSKASLNLDFVDSSPEVPTEDNGLSSPRQVLVADVSKRPLHLLEVAPVQQCGLVNDQDPRHPDQGGQGALPADGEATLFSGVQANLSIGVLVSFYLHPRVECPAEGEQVGGEAGGGHGKGHGAARLTGPHSGQQRLQGERLPAAAPRVDEDADGIVGVDVPHHLVEDLALLARHQAQTLPHQSRSLQ